MSQRLSRQANLVGVWGFDVSARLLASSARRIRATAVRPFAAVAAVRLPSSVPASCNTAPEVVTSNTIGSTSNSDLCSAVFTKAPPTPSTMSSYSRLAPIDGGSSSSSTTGLLLDTMKAPSSAWPSALRASLETEAVPAVSPQLSQESERHEQ